MVKHIFLGAYSPLTMEGNIMVDGILASCYAYGDHDSAHFGMMPIRWFPELIEWIFGVGNAFPVYVETMGDLAGLIIPQRHYTKQ